MFLAVYLQSELERTEAKVFSQSGARVCASSSSAKPSRESGVIVFETLKAGQAVVLLLLVLLSSNEAFVAGPCVVLILFRHLRDERIEYCTCGKTALN